MFRDITFGQYYPTQSFIHSMDARIKIVLNMLYMIVVIFFVTSFMSFALLTLFLVVAILASHVPLKSILKSIKGIVFLLIFTALLNVFINKNGTKLVEWWIITITDEGLITGAKIILRLTCLIMGSSLLTFTTTPVDLTHGIESLLKPLKWLHFPVREFALIMSLTLSLIPSLIEETDRIIRAQKARGADFDTGGLIKRAKAFVPILIPLLISSFRRAEELALAMDSRCFEGATNVTKMRVMKLSWRDAVGSIITLLVMAALITVWAMSSQWASLVWLYF